MTQRLRRILIMIVMALLTVTLMAASLLCSVTYARYAGGKFDEEKSIYDPIIEFVGANQYEVYSPEELVEAIENGYSYIKIGKGAEEPFVITTGVTDVTANLVIDLNGTTIVRNSRNPVLDVQRNVSAVLVYDSTVENAPNAQPGSFYNPVGSALQVSGGTLTVAAGRYDSGPKTNIATSLPSDASDTISATVYSRTNANRVGGSYASQGQIDMPKLTEDVYVPQGASDTGYDYIEADTYLIYSLEQNCYVNNNQLYVNAVKEVDEGGTAVYTGDALAVPCNAASCDFYYYYQIDAGDADNDYDQTYAVIYGYNDVKGLAEDEDDNNDGIGEATALIDDGLVWPYAAVRSIRSTETVQEGEGRTTGGEGFMRGGAFSTYFGTENTYGIYAEGGTLTVADGVSFTAVGEGVCIHSEPGGDENQDTSADAASLEISGGTFSSELGDTIQMEGGSVTITGGTFEKNASSASSESTDNGSAIDIQGGSLKVNEKDTTAAATKSVIFTVTGDHVNGIKMDKGTETGTETQTADVIKNVTFDFNQSDGGTYVAAIQVAGGTLEVSGSIFNFNRKASSNTAFSHNNGIYVRSSGEEDAAQSGTVTAANCTFNFGNDSNSSVTASAGIASVGGEVTAKNCTFKLPGYSNYGIYATGGETTVTGGSITMTGRDTTQIGSGENAARGNDNFGINISGGEVTVSGCEISVSGTYSSGVLATNGTVNLSGTNLDSTTITITNSQTTETENYQTISTLTSSAVSSEGGTINLTGTVEIKSDSLGITARGTINVGDETTQAAANVTVNTDNATGVYVNNGTLNVNAGATLGVTSTVKSNTRWVQPPEGQTAIPPSIYNGVYVNGGSLVSEGTLNVTFTGVQNDARDTSQGATVNTDYLTQQTKSYAVRVETAASGSDTEVKITAGTIINQVQYDEQGKEIAGGGGGVLVNGGTVTLGKQETTNGVTTYSGPTVQTTGSQVAETNIMIPSADRGWAYSWNLTGGDAVKVVNGSLTAHGGSYSAVRGNGILVNSSDQNTQTIVNSGNFVGGDGSSSIPGAAASYGFKVLSGSININGGSFGTTNSTGGGAFVMNGKAYITKATIQTGGSTGFAVWDGADVTFEPEKDEDINVSAEATGLTLENGGTYGDLTVTIKGGTFSSTNQQEDNKNGIWYGNENARLIISGGSFTGTTGSGLSIGAVPNYDGDTETYNIQLSGGSFIGGRNAPISNYKTNYLVSGAWTSGYNTSGQTFYIHS